ncbi:CopD family protein [Flavobacterium foetidum]|uniref:CopD family protein n=1 Tax=Flavobacterium foetidum TaxID=2026681 RepID=UPI001074D3BD|nr:CopD family protein [Flavobacterium foetidum]KAF2508834.1 copper resistance protein CopD [Flavobacterium foetidum]
MTLHHLVLIIHLLSATVWVGGHLFLMICILPTALKEKNPALILNFEKKFEKLGMSSLVLLILTGIWMAIDFGVTFESWFHFKAGFEKVISIKLLLLFATFCCAVCAQFYILPNLRPNSIWKMAIVIVTVTMIGITMLILGSTLRYGGI